MPTAFTALPQSHSTEHLSPTCAASTLSSTSLTAATLKGSSWSPDGLTIVLQSWGFCWAANCNWAGCGLDCTVAICCNFWTVASGCKASETPGGTASMHMIWESSKYLWTSWFPKSWAAGLASKTLEGLAAQLLSTLAWPNSCSGPTTPNTWSVLGAHGMAGRWLGIGPIPPTPNIGAHGIAGWCAICS